MHFGKFTRHAEPEARFVRGMCSELVRVLPITHAFAPK